MEAEMSSQGTAIQLGQTTVPVKRGPDGNLETRFNDMFGSIARRAFELFEGNGRWFGHDLDDWFRAESELLHPLHMEVRETDRNFTVSAEVPGFTGKDLEINVEPRSLKISGKRETKKEEKKGKTIHSELCSDQIMRSIELPADVDTSKVSASLKDGILTIDLPKPAQGKSVRIEPKAS
jgi:HSP20 family protein